MRNYVSTNSTNDPSTYVGTKGEITVDPVTSQVKVHDGSTPGGLAIGSGGSSDRLVNGSYQTVLDSSGNLTLPNSGIVNDNVGSIDLIPSGGADNNQKLVISPTQADGNHIHLTSGDLSVTDIFLGNDRQYVRTRTDEGMAIGTGGGELSGGNSWTFGIDGVLTLPGGITSSTGSIVLNPNVDQTGSSWTITSDQFGPGTSALMAPAGDDQHIGEILFPTSSGIGAGIAWISNQTLGATVSNTFVIQSYGNVTTAAADSVVISSNTYINETQHSWTFGADGILTLPAGGEIRSVAGLALSDGGIKFVDGTTQTTAYTGGSSSPAGAGTSSYSDVWVFSTKADSFWTSYTLSGTIKGIFGSADVTPSSQVVYGKQLGVGDKILGVNDTAIHTDSYYGMVAEFPANPSIGDTFSIPFVNPSITVNAGSFVTGKTYMITSVGNTNWTAVGASGGYIGQSFVATGAGSGTGTASSVNGVGKLIFKTASGQRAITLNNGGQGGSVIFGQGTSNIAGYLDLSSQMGSQPITWVYAGMIDSVPTWYQLYF
jgi:hypothetical protein